jgi:hypothetical protein
VGEGGPIPTPEQFASRNEADSELKMQPRDIRMKNIGYGLMFLAWYIGASLFVMYRLKGDDLDSLEKEVMMRERRKKEMGLI